MTPKERAAMQQALEALEEIHVGNMTPIAEENWKKAITALREALAEPQVDWYEEAMRLAGLNAKNVGELRKLEAEQAEQEPVGYFTYDGDYNIWEEVISKDTYGAVPLYAHPELPKFSALAAEYSRGREDGYEAGVQFMKEQAEQEPVGIYYGEAKGVGHIVRLDVELPVGTKLYTHPVRTKYLTDEEINEVLWRGGPFETVLDATRAVIAADREKNK